MKSLDSVFRSQAILGVIVSSIILFLVCLVHVSATENNRLHSFYQQLGQRLDSDRDHIFNLLLLNQSDNLGQLINEYMLNYPIKKMEVQSAHCYNCQPVTKNLLRDVNVKPAELIYELDNAVGAIRIVPDISMITQRKELVVMYAALYLAGLVFYFVFIFGFYNSIRRRFIIPIHQFLNSLDQDESVFSNEIATSSFLEKYASHGRSLAEQAMIEDRFLVLLKRINVYQKQLRMKEVEASVGKIASQVAHDIRSPLSSLKAVSLLLKEHVAGNKAAMEIVNLLQLSGNRLENIANDLLIQHQSEIFSISSVLSIHEVLDELIGEFRATPLGAGVVFKKQYNSGALYVSGDKTGLARAVGNIIKNSLEAMQNNPEKMSRELVFNTHLHSDSSASTQGDMILIRITDTGPGIRAEKIPFILQGGYTEGKEDGHGIGTRVVREVVDAHMGTLSVESEVGKGASFIITLPATNIATQDSAMTVTIPYSGQSPIRIIDDEPSLREQWRLTLKGFGVEVETYQSWEDFESVLRQGGDGRLDKFADTFIVDYHFDNSEVDGLEIIRRLKERGFVNMVLATAEYWKPVIKSAAEEQNITLCPKPLPKVVMSNNVIVDRLGKKTPPSSDVQEEVFSREAPSIGNPNCSVLLIDDDEGIHVSWNAMKDMLGIKQLAMYRRLEDMILAATNPADYDLCVIDKNIENSRYNGSMTLAYLKQNGARKVLLATGESQKNIAQDPGFLGVDGVITEKIPMSLEKYLIN